MSDLSGMSHEDFMAVSGLAVLPPVPISTKPLPVEYHAAIKAIAACKNIDDAKYWDNKADALAAWAKIYADDQVAREARSLKLHAYRRIGILAGELRQWRPAGRGNGSVGGARSILIENGFSTTNAGLITKIASADENRFNEIANSEKPPSPSVMVSESLRPNPTFAKVSNRLRQLRSGVRNVEKLVSIDALGEQELASMSLIISDIMEQAMSIGALVSEALAQKRLRRSA